ncbi:hypothetical protein LUZ63_020358 [Rhynchospora breviuscula]|uniref:peptidoglycan glycosyltransferase n=1 Tax=Rhynchospora breviuscula TaxID=2022672 RepID=A0A9Q0C0Z2_9POAL|nr:hypothetical protein LUZ63_020358 [Rhynchospora breviuscula]
MGSPSSLSSLLASLGVGAARVAAVLRPDVGALAVRGLPLGLDEVGEPGELALHRLPAVPLQLGGVPVLARRRALRLAQPLEALLETGAATLEDPQADVEVGAGEEHEADVEAVVLPRGGPGLGHLRGEVLATGVGDLVAPGRASRTTAAGSSRAGGSGACGARSRAAGTRAAARGPPSPVSRPAWPSARPLLVLARCVDRTGRPGASREPIVPIHRGSAIRARPRRCGVTGLTAAGPRSAGTARTSPYPRGVTPPSSSHGGPARARPVSRKGGRPGGRKPTRPGTKGGGRSGWRRLLRASLIGALVLVLVGALGFIAAYTTTSIPDPNADFQTQTTNVYYRGGKSTLGRFVDQNRESVSYDKVPKHVRDAVIAAEDRTFWTNKGIDPKGIVRAAFSNARGNSTQGASTITQQYVKILYLSSERSLTRKAREALVSLKLQKQQSKREILEGYLNTIYFGRGAYGIQAAAQAYFERDVSELNVKQGAALAAVLNSPGNYDPAEGPEAAQRLLSRYRYVLDGMAKLGDLDASTAQEDAESLPKFPTIEKTQTYGGQRGFMLEMVRKELKEKGFSDSTIDGGGLKITTTFSRPVMRAVQEGVEEERPPGFKALHVGAVSIDVKTGAVRGLYGGQDYLKSAFNWPEAGAQPGSSFKPFALAAGLEDGFSLKDTFEGNSPYQLDDGTTVRNEGGGNGTSYGSAISALKATEESVNTAFVDMTESMKNGPTKIRTMAKRLGIPVEEDKIPANIGISLGSERVSAIDMANAYATIANKGVEHPWHVVQKVTRASDGKTLYEAPDDDKRVLPADIASDVSYALQGVVTSGTGTAALDLGRPAAGKTGTATNDKDQVSSAWFVGYTPQLSTAVMYVRGDGNDQLDGWLPSYFGGSYPARTWTSIMGKALEGTDVEDFPEPAYVDGDAPDEGHSPLPVYTPPPAPEPEPSQEPRKRQKPKKSQTPKPSPSPTQAPSTPTTPPPPGGGTNGGTGGTGGGTGRGLLSGG